MESRRDDTRARSRRASTAGIWCECRRPPAPGPLLFSFHGYGEDAATNMTALHRIPDVSGWLLVAVQALHPFYTKSERVVASWMTRQDRELAIADNLAYVTAVVEAVQREFEMMTSAIAFAGFSQGGAMAYRAAAYRAAATPGAGGVIVLAADVPPDVAAPGSLSVRADRPRTCRCLVHRRKDGRRPRSAGAGGRQCRNLRV